MAVAVLGRREHNKVEKRGRIMAAARALFSHKGFEATTTQEIAEAAGVAAGTVFSYARTKEDLLILVFHDEMLAVVERAYGFAGRGDGGLVDRLIVFFEMLVAHHERDLSLAHALMRQLGCVGSAEQRSMINDLMTTLLRRLAQLVDAAKARGEVAARSPLHVSARMVFALYYFHLGKMLSGYIDRTQFDRDLRNDFELLLTGLT